MKKYLTFAIVLFFGIIIWGCSTNNNQLDSDNNQSDFDTILSATLLRYPQLPRSQGKQSEFYKLIRSVIIGDTGIELQLRSSPDTLNNPQKIIIVTNSSKEQYIIPFFSNAYPDYWDFQFDNISNSMEPVNTTFEIELKKCLAQFNFNDTLNTSGLVINEMLLSLLQCKRLTDADSLNLQEVKLRNDRKFPDENSDSCQKRLQANWQEMQKYIHPKDFIINYNAYWDESNHRVYQFNRKCLDSKQRFFDFTMKNYRLSCIHHWDVIKL